MRLITDYLRFGLRSLIVCVTVIVACAAVYRVCVKEKQRLNREIESQRAFYADRPGRHAIEVVVPANEVIGYRVERLNVHLSNHVVGTDGRTAAFGDERRAAE